MQRVLTIDLKAGDHGDVQEFLEAELRQGWRVMSVTAAGAGQNIY